MCARMHTHAEYMCFFTNCVCVCVEGAGGMLCGCGCVCVCVCVKGKSRVEQVALRTH